MEPDQTQPQVVSEDDLLRRMDKIIEEVKQISDKKWAVSGENLDFFRGLNLRQREICKVMNKSIARSPPKVLRQLKDANYVMQESFDSRLDDESSPRDENTEDLNDYEWVEFCLGEHLDWAFRFPLDDTVARILFRRWYPDQEPEVFILLCFTEIPLAQNEEYGSLMEILNLDFKYLGKVVKTTREFLANAEPGSKTWMFHPNIQQVIAQRSDLRSFTAFRRGLCSIHFP